jgi:mono/diheme cytochrome c family protein
LSSSRKTRATSRAFGCGIDKLPFAIAGFTALLIVPTILRPQSAPASPAQGDNEKGRQEFVERKCSLCHGVEGQGVAQAGPRISPPGPTAGFVQSVRQPAGDMPPVSAQRVPDTELADMYAFLRSIAPPQSASNDSSGGASGNADDGKPIYITACSRCHGADGKGLPDNGPKISPPADKLTDFIAFVRNPTRGGDMLPISPERVSDAQLTDIYAFLQAGSHP